MLRYSSRSLLGVLGKVVNDFVVVRAGLDTHRSSISEKNFLHVSTNAFALGYCSRSTSTWTSGLPTMLTIPLGGYAGFCCVCCLLTVVISSAWFDVTLDIWEQISARTIY